MRLAVDDERDFPLKHLPALGLCEVDMLGNIPTGESGPARRVYALTELGVEQLEGWTLTIKREIDAMNRFLKAYASQPTGPQADSP